MTREVRLGENGIFLFAETDKEGNNGERNKKSYRECVMIIAEGTINAAFDQLQNHPEYESWNKGFRETIDLYKAADKAFNDQNDLNNFKTVYDTLRRWWQVFRHAKQYWTPEETYIHLNNLDQGIREISLSGVRPRDWPRIWDCIYRIREIKQTEKGSSLVAISKFLHFWNPRLFIIFDSEVMENWVFGHYWLSAQLNAAPYDDVVDHLPEQECHEKQLIKYLRVLLFSADLIKVNPLIMQGFKRHAEKLSGHSRYIEIEKYEARAIEIFLMGLVELPPIGVVVNG